MCKFNVDGYCLLLSDNEVVQPCVEGPCGYYEEFHDYTLGDDKDE